MPSPYAYLSFTVRRLDTTSDSATFSLHRKETLLVIAGSLKELVFLPNDRKCIRHHQDSTPADYNPAGKNLHVSGRQ